MIKGIDTYRKECRYRSLNHDRNIERDQYLQNVSKLQRFQNGHSAEDQMKKDGLTSLKYEKISQEILSEKTRLIKVNL
jgi:predicted RNA-binding protein